MLFDISGREANARMIRFTQSIGAWRSQTFSDEARSEGFDSVVYLRAGENVGSQTHAGGVQGACAEAPHFLQRRRRRSGVRVHA